MDYDIFFFLRVNSPPLPETIAISATIHEWAHSNQSGSCFCPPTYPQGCHLIGHYGQRRRFPRHTLLVLFAAPPPERYGLSFCTTSTSDHVHPCRHLILCMGLKLLVFTALRGLRGGPCRAVMAVNSLGGGVWRYLQHCCHWSGQSLACEYIYVCIACTLWRGPLSWNKAACPFTSDRCYPSVVIASWRLSRISFSRTLAMATFTRVEPALMEIA